MGWKNNSEHIKVLEEKLNRYLSFIESGEVYEAYPDAEERKFLIRIYAKHEPDQEGFNFLSDVKKIIEQAGFYFEFKIHDEKKSNA